MTDRPIEESSAAQAARFGTYIDELIAALDSANAQYSGDLDAEFNRAFYSFIEARHAANLARAIRNLPADTSPLLIAPLTRAVFEHGLTAAWLWQVHDSMPTFVKEIARNKKNVLSQTRAWALPMSQEAYQELDTRIAEAEAASQITAGPLKIERMCNDFDTNHHLYGIYRWLCALTHASVDVLDAYVDETAPNNYTLMRTPRDGLPLHVQLHTVASALVWSGWAVHHAHHDKSRRSMLRRIEAGLRVRGNLQPTHQARARSERNRKV